MVPKYQLWQATLGVGGQANRAYIGTNKEGHTYSWWFGCHTNRMGSAVELCERDIARTSRHLELAATQGRPVSASLLLRVCAADARVVVPFCEFIELKLS